MSHSNILVIGATGFLGSHIIHRLEPECAWGTFTSTRPKPDGYRYVYLNLQEPEAAELLLDQLAPECVILVAAKSNVDWCEQNRDSAQIINAAAPASLAQACARRGIRFIFTSSDMVFDGKKGGYHEEDAPNPISWYGRTKYLAEEAILSAYPEALVLRLALIYGVPVAPGRGRSFLTWIFEQLAAGLDVPLFFDQFRTPIFVEDLAAAILALGRMQVQGVLHLAGPEKLDRYTFGCHVCEIFGYSTERLRKQSLRDAKFAAPRPVDLSMQARRAQQILGNTFSDCKTALKIIKQKRIS